MLITKSVELKIRKTGYITVTLNFQLPNDNEFCLHIGIPSQVKVLKAGPN